MLAEELPVLDGHPGNSASWRSVRPLIDAALLLEQHDNAFSWHGWNKHQIDAFLQQLPARCSLIVGVWEDDSNDSNDSAGNSPFSHEPLVFGSVCEVVEGKICSIRTFEALADAGLKPVQELEAGINDVLEIMRVARNEVAPVAWALFTSQSTWNEWLFADNEYGDVIDRGILLAEFAQKGRCVLMGSQAGQHHHQ